MSFWKTYPVQNIFKKELFKDLQFEKEDIVSQFEVKRVKNIAEIREIKIFLKSHFGGPMKPVLDIPEDKLHGKKDTILYVKTTEMAGCLRYHYIGTFLDKEIYCVDCFCIHPMWRKKGLASYLLTELHKYANKNNIPYAMWLKEGAPLSIILHPHYSSTYVYKEITKSTKTKRITKCITIDEAYRFLDIFCEFKDIFIVRNKDAEQYWVLYQNGLHKVLACIQDTYQYLNGKKMGWITGWIESAMSDEYREEACNQICDSIDIFDYMWGNKKWIGNSKEWKQDGNFHWYLYQWTTSINIKDSYCILN